MSFRFNARMENEMRLMFNTHTHSRRDTDALTHATQKHYNCKYLEHSCILFHLRTNKKTKYIAHTMESDWSKKWPKLMLGQRKKRRRKWPEKFLLRWSNEKWSNDGRKRSSERFSVIRFEINIRFFVRIGCSPRCRVLDSRIHYVQPWWTNEIVHSGTNWYDIFLGKSLDNHS